MYLLLNQDASAPASALPIKVLARSLRSMPSAISCPRAPIFPQVFLKMLTIFSSSTSSRFSKSSNWSSRKTRQATSSRAWASGSESSFSLRISAATRARSASGISGWMAEEPRSSATCEAACDFCFARHVKYPGRVFGNESRAISHLSI